jgi:putative membrane protein
MGYGYGYGWGWMAALNGLFWLVIVLLAVLLFVRLGRSAAHPPHPPHRPGLDILEERYAKGEIGRDEYLQKKQDLGG